MFDYQKGIGKETCKAIYLQTGNDHDSNLPKKKKILIWKLVIKGVFFLYSSRAIENLYHLDLLNLCQIGDVRLLPSMTNILKE